MKDIQGRRVAGWGVLQEKGDFCIVDPGDPSFHTTVTIIGFICPCCGEKRHVALRPSDPEGWNWNGSYDQPTLTPSIWFNRDYPDARCRWHGHITAGVFRNA